MSLKEVSGRYDGPTLESDVLDFWREHDVFEQTRLRHGSKEPNGHCKVAINDHMADWDSPVSDGDTVLLFPPVAGG